MTESEGARVFSSFDVANYLNFMFKKVVVSREKSTVSGNTSKSPSVYSKTTYWGGYLGHWSEEQKVALYFGEVLGDKLKNISPAFIKISGSSVKLM